MKKPLLVATFVFVLAASGTMIGTIPIGQAQNARIPDAIEAESFQLDQAPETAIGTSAIGLSNLTLSTVRMLNMEPGIPVDLQIEVKNTGDAQAYRKKTESMPDDLFGGEIGIRYEVLPMNGAEPELEAGSFRNGYLYTSGPLGPGKSETVHLSTSLPVSNMVVFAHPGIYLIKFTVDPPTASHPWGYVEEYLENDNVAVVVANVHGDVPNPPEELDLALAAAEELIMAGSMPERHLTDEELRQIWEDQDTALPDLRPEADPQLIARSGKDFSTRITIHNDGKGAAFEGGDRLVPQTPRRGVRMGYRITRPDTGEVILASGKDGHSHFHTMEPIEPGGQDTIAFAILAYEDVALFQKPGKYQIEFFADPVLPGQPIGLVEESDETNNTISVELLVLPKIANLTITAPASISAAVGEEVLLPVAVRNIGGVTAAVKNATDDTEDPSTQKIAVKYEILAEKGKVPALVEGARPTGYLYTAGPLEPLQEDSVFPNGPDDRGNIGFAEPGTYRIRLMADAPAGGKPGGAVREWNEYDNRFEMEVVVRAD